MAQESYQGLGRDYFLGVQVFSWCPLLLAKQNKGLNIVTVKVN